MTPGQRLLMLGGALSGLAALLHLACIAGGPDWFRFFGAGEGIARSVERGEATPIVMTVGIASVLALWAAYGFSGAGRLGRLPLLRTGLIVIAAIYLARGAIVLFPSLWDRPDLSPAFMLWSSLIVLVYGVAYAAGTWLAWPTLSRKEAR